MKTAISKQIIIHSEAMYILNTNTLIALEMKASTKYLAEAFDVQDNSLLGCQLQIEPKKDGLEVELAFES